MLPAAPPGSRPVLDLSGAKLDEAFAALAAASEDAGGVEQYVDAIKLKSALFAETLGHGRARHVELGAFRGACAWIATARRRIGPYIEPETWSATREAVVELLEGAEAASGADARLDRFCARFPEDRAHRLVRDLAAEILHFTDPERYPLMARWVWDAHTNTGMLREIWHGDDAHFNSLDVPATFETFVVLREELAQFLASRGVYRDMTFFIDLLSAQVYARYIHEQGGSYLRADFASAEPPMVHVRRLLGLDAVSAKGRLRLKAADGTAVAIKDLARPS